MISKFRHFDKDVWTNYYIRYDIGWCALIYTCMAGSCRVPPACQDDEDDPDGNSKMDDVDSSDFMDQGLQSLTCTGDLGLMVTFLSEVPDWTNWIEDNLPPVLKALDDLLVPIQDLPPDGINIHEAIQVSSVNRLPLSYRLQYHTRYWLQYRIRFSTRYCTRYITWYLMQCFCQQGLLPAMDRDMTEVLTGSEYLAKTCAERHSRTATAINDIMKNILHTWINNSMQTRLTLTCSSAWMLL